jgi:6-phosphogluconolactonase
MGHSAPSDMTNLVIEATPDALAMRVAKDLIQAVRKAADENRKFCLALSGGTTPKLLYQHLGSPALCNSMPWGNLELFWGDERCVPPTESDSNFRMVSEAMLNHVPLGASQIHRVRGEDVPEQESARYAEVIRSAVPSLKGGLPRFDWMLLGMGDDGHTASIFPGLTLKAKNDLCGVASHPTSGAIRVSVTMELINASAHVAFVVAGSSKAKFVHTFVDRLSGREQYPAAHVEPTEGTLTWYVDEAASRDLSNETRARANVGSLE